MLVGLLYCRLLHHIHHKYNKEHTLSPFAGLAFHPLDGILQAVPYTWTMFFCPMHFMTHEILLFATGVWTANIHDNIHGKVRSNADPACVCLLCVFVRERILCPSGFSHAHIVAGL